MSIDVLTNLIQLRWLLKMENLCYLCLVVQTSHFMARKKTHIYRLDLQLFLTLCISLCCSISFCCSVSLFVLSREQFSLRLVFVRILIQPFACSFLCICWPLLCNCTRWIGNNIQCVCVNVYCVSFFFVSHYWKP